jgi:ABC-type uncharacterized transport system substrate-binding protein
MRIFIILLAGLSATAQGVTQKPAVAVVTITEVEAYAQALEGIREQLPDVQVWDARDERRLRENLAKGLPALVIAVGSGAAATLERVAPSQLALVSSVVLECELESGGGKSLRFRTAVTVDLPPEVLLRQVGRLFPDKSRIGVIRGPMQTDAYMKAFEQAAHRGGLTVEVMTCQHSRDVVEAFLKLRSRADLVWCPPNAQLYNSATLKPLLIASLTHRLPIIGFSEQFVQAGALFGGSADYVDVGRQTAALALRVARNEPVPLRQEARKFRFAYNQRVARMLGVRAAIPDQPEDELVIIR